MSALLIFSLVLFAALLFSDLADRSVLSMAVLFLVAGFVVGPGVMNYLHLTHDDPIVRHLAELALFSVLFTDGMRAAIGDVISAWRLPGRALFFGMPLTLITTALLAYFLAGVSWIEALLIGAILSPTDPVFAAAIVGKKEIPARLKHLLNIESGLNDGLALPLVLICLSVIGKYKAGYAGLGLELLLGLVVGVAVPLLACWVRRASFFGVAKPYEPLFAVALGLVVLASATLLHANIYLAAFAAGVTVASTRPELREEFHEFGELITELLKLATLLVFGALISPHLFVELHALDFLFAALALLLARPAAMFIALWRSELDWRERVTASWFGPKGFASVVFGLLLFEREVPHADRLFRLCALVIVGSIVAHSSTDTLLARWFVGKDGQPTVEPEEEPAA
ncbi:MAG TPA: cation:proton antiporter [Chthoniobacterales bacterium]|nr:cation:proton antiporter [Chthoniobacterales bacterium]